MNKKELLEIKKLGLKRVRIIALNRRLDMFFQIIDDYQNEAEEVEKEMKKLGAKYEPYKY